MFRSINIRSFLIGGLLIFSVMCLIGAAGNISPDYYGRFQMTTDHGFAFILDSATGQVWSEEFFHESDGHTAYVDPNDEFHSPKLTINDDIYVPE